MKTKNLFFAVLTLAALSAGLVSCDDVQDLKDQQKFNVTVVSLDDAMGTVTGSGQYPAGSEIVITATANEGYSFQKWHDGNTENPRTVTVTADATYTAIFAASYDPGQYFYVTVVSSNEVIGTVKGEGNYPAGAKINIMATPNTESYFQQWSDGNTDNPRTVVVNSDTTFTANFAKKPYLTVEKNNSNYGTVSGSSGYYMPGDEVTITATPKFGFEFVEWNDGNIDNPRTVTINEDITYTAKFEVIPMVIAGTENGYDYVDLGLPSGLKWATCNVGATSPEEYGNYFAWGETTTKATYSWDTYTLTTDGGSTFTKYNTTDGKTVLELADDAARVNWGGAWRMPTDAEWTELCKNCTWTWTDDYNGTGVAGRIVTGTNGNSIFLPAAGFRIDGGFYNNGGSGLYWSSSLDTDHPYNAWCGYFYSDLMCWNDSLYRYYGHSVRPVLGE